MDNVPPQDAMTTPASDFSYGDADTGADELAELLASMLPSEAAAASAAARAAAAAVVNAAYARATGADALSFARIQRAITNPQARPPAQRSAAARGLLRVPGTPRAHPLCHWAASRGVRVTMMLQLSRAVMCRSAEYLREACASGAMGSTMPGLRNFGGPRRALCRRSCASSSARCCACKSQLPGRRRRRSHARGVAGEHGSARPLECTTLTPPPDTLRCKAPRSGRGRRSARRRGGRRRRRAPPPPRMPGAVRAACAFGRPDHA
jgi:hypothetical protein